MKRLNILLPLPLAEKLRAFQLKTGLSASDIIRRALDLLLKEADL